MSVLNQMLRDLEKRGAVPDVVAAAGTATVARPALAGHTPARSSSRRWIWAGVLVICAAFVAVHTWLAYRVQEAGNVRKPLGADLFAAVANVEPPPPAPASTNTPANPPAASAPVAVAVPTVTAEPARAQVAAVAPRAASIQNTKPAPVALPTGPAKAAKPAPPAQPKAVAPVENAAPAHAVQPAAQPAEETVAVTRSTAAVAADLDRAADLISRGRSTEAMDLLTRVLVRQPTHAGARGSLAALLAEAGKREQALQVLLAGSEIDPLQFAAPAAQLQAELGNLSGALATLARVPTARRRAQDEALYAGLAQRAGDHMTALAAYRRALAHPQPDAVWWVGLAVSLEATGEPAEARNAYTRAAAEARLPADIRTYVANRLTVLGNAARDDARKADLANVF